MKAFTILLLLSSTAITQIHSYNASPLGGNGASSSNPTVKSSAGHRNRSTSVHKFKDHLNFKLDAYIDTSSDPTMMIQSIPSTPKLWNQNDKICDAIRTHLEDYGMPWSQSIQKQKKNKNTSNDDVPLHYMPFLKWQIEFMQEHLTDLELVPLPSHFTYKENDTGTARIFNVCFKSAEYRKIRLTYYDVGEECQVFNSLWYPRETRGDGNLPVLGTDLLSFHGRNRNLAVVDFQPVVSDLSSDNSVPMPPVTEKKLSFVKSKYPSLHGRMSKRFYDENQFFSKQMLFAKYDKGGIFDVCKCLFPAYQDYVKAHVEMVKNSSTNSCASIEMKENALSRQRAYDVYSADRDPAVAMFNKQFGVEWSDSFVHDFLFSLSKT